MTPPRAAPLREQATRPFAARRRAAVALAGAGLLAVVAACSPNPSERYEPAYSPQPRADVAAVYVLAVHPLHSPRRLFDVYQPLVDYLNARLPGVSIRLEASSDYGTFEGKLARREVHLALPNPYQTIESLQHGYRVFAKMGDDDSFRGIILVRKDGGIKSAQDLIGKSVSYPAPTALAAAMMTQWLLHQQGIDVVRDLDNRYVGTQESSIMNVALGQTAAGATWASPWRAFAMDHPELAAQLYVKWQTPALLNNALIARDDMPAPTVERIAELLVGLHQDDGGRAILERMGLSRFERATSQTYAPVREFIDRFEKEVRPVKGRS